MGNHREHFLSVLEGQHPENMPFFPDMTDWYVANRIPDGAQRTYGPGEFIPDDDPIHKLSETMPAKYRGMTQFDFYREFDWRFHVHIANWHTTTFTGGVCLEETVLGGRLYHRLHTPKGRLTRVDLHASDGTWTRREFYVKNLDDLQIMRYVVENARFHPAYDNVPAIRRELGQWGQGDIVIGRSPFGKLVHEYMGFERVVYALTDNPREMQEFMKIQEQKDLELIRLATRAPERLVIISDRADENLISPAQWREYCVPFYRQATEILHAAGKFVSTHLDGNFKGFFAFLNQPGFDLLDGCTSAPMFNYEVEELAAALPEGMYAFCGVPATLFCQHLPTRVILQFADRIMAALKGRGILNVGDILPPNGDIEQVIALGDYVKGTWI